MGNKPTTAKVGRTNLMHLGMMACCAVMLLPILGFLAAGGTIGGLLSNSVVFLPLLLCVGAHLVMHKVMGRSCHGSAEDADAKATRPLLADIRTEEQTGQKL